MREIFAEIIDFSEIILVLVGLSAAFLLKNHRFSRISVSWTEKLVLFEGTFGIIFEDTLGSLLGTF